MNGSKLAVVTGASRRLARTTALDLDQRGFVLSIHYHNSQREAEITAGEIREHGGTTFLLQANLRDEKQVSLKFSSIEESEFDLDV